MVWDPPRPGVVLSIEMPVQQVYNVSDFKLYMQHYVEWGPIIVTTIDDMGSGPSPSNNRTMIEDMEGKNVQSVMRLFTDIREGELQFTTDGNIAPNAAFSETKCNVQMGMDTKDTTKVRLQIVSPEDMVSGKLVTTTFTNLRVANP
jgi:hypothetical protein